jgi:hypothetical protein
MFEGKFQTLKFKNIQHVIASSPDSIGTTKAIRASTLKGITDCFTLLATQAGTPVPPIFQVLICVF